MDTSKLKFKADIRMRNAMKRALRRIAHEIIENNDGVENLRLVGIQRRRDAGEDAAGDDRTGGGQ